MRAASTPSAYRTRLRCRPSSTRCPGPVNVIANPRTGSAAGSLEDLQVMGVHRVTFGPKLMQELAPDLTALVTPWR